MNRTAFAVVASLALLIPAVTSAASFKVRDVNTLGGLDSMRASVIAGSPVQRVAKTSISNDPALERRLDRMGLNALDIEGVYLDSRGTYWVFVDDDAA